MIKAVIFDVDGVLIDSFEANLKFYQNIMTHFGYRPPTREEYPNYFYLTMWDAIKMMTGLTEEEEIEKIWQVSKSRNGMYPLELLKVPDGLKLTIAILNEKYSLGIVTSRVRECVYESPDLAEIQNYFQVAISYDDTENHKPHPEPLLLSMEKLGVKPEEAVYIGDAQSDIIAARAAGMKMIIYSKQTLADADRCTSLFKQLPELIESL
jgi:pyrophosphatase PpaX